MAADEEKDVPFPAYPGLPRIVSVEGRRKFAMLLWQYDVSRTPGEVNKWIDRFIETLEEELADPDFQNDLLQLQTAGRSMAEILSWLPERIFGEKEDEELW